MSNIFEALEDEEDNGKGSKEKARTGDNDKEVVGDKISMKDWVNKSFGKITDAKKDLKT